MGAAIDDRDVQGLVRFAHGDLTEACFYLLTVVNPAAARSWLSAKSRMVTTAAKTGSPEDRPKKALQIAFSWEGLRALGFPTSVEGFSLEFMSGMAGDENRSRRLGDVGASDPSTWRWGGPGGVPDVLLMLYAGEGLPDEWKREIEDEGWSRAFHLRLRLPTSYLGDREPFGFKDGISQPTLDWEQRPPAKDRGRRYGNVLAPGEFLLGYANEYGKYTERPLVAASDDPHGLLPEAEGYVGRKDFGRNGTYLVFRDLQQDVRGFWRFVDEQAGGDRKTREQLGALMMGRTMDGEPLVPLVDDEIAGVEREQRASNQFTYDDDAAGVRCPIGAHIRRANPRTADLPAGSTGRWARILRLLGFGGRGVEDDLVASARFHRLLRRGREYGERLSVERALSSASIDGEARGLRFICLNANITRQFEFVQNAWIMGSKFAGLTDESDPLLGSRTGPPGRSRADQFSMPVEGGLARRLTGIPQFVSVRGGGYFFLPSMRALRYLAHLGS